MSAIILPKIDNFLGSISQTTDKGHSGFLTKSIGSVLGVGGSKLQTNAVGAVLGGVASLVPGGNLVKGVLGFLTNGEIGENISRFIKSGFKFSCLGKQAFNNNDLQRDMADVEKRFNDAKTAGTIGAFEEFANHLNRMIQISDIEISRFRSACSKQLKGEYRDRIQEIVNQLLSSFEFTSVDTRHDQPNFGSFNYAKLKFIAPKGSSVPTITPPVVNPTTPSVNPIGDAWDKFMADYGDDIKKYAVGSGMDENIALKTAYEYFQNNFNGSGSVSVGNGGLDWQVSAGSSSNNNWLLYGIIGIAVWKLMSK